MAQSGYPIDERTIGDEVSSSEEEGSVVEDPILAEYVVGTSTVAVETPTVQTPADVPASSNAGTAEVATKGYKSVTFKVEIAKHIDIATYASGMSVLKDELDHFTTSAEAREMKKRQECLIMGEIAKLRIINEKILELQKVETKNKPKKDKTKKTDNTEIDITLRFSYNGTVKSLTTTLGSPIGDVRKKVGDAYKLPKKDWKHLVLKFGDFDLTSEIDPRSTVGGETLKKHKNIHLKDDDLIMVTLVKQ